MRSRGSGGEESHGVQMLEAAQFGKSSAQPVQLQVPEKRKERVGGIDEMSLKVFFVHINGFIN